jgi:hypothetical protein
MVFATKSLPYLNAVLRQQTTKNKCDHKVNMTSLLKFKGHLSWAHVEYIIRVGRQ